MVAKIYDINGLVETLSKCCINTATIVVPCHVVEAVGLLFIERFKSSRK